MEHQSPSSTASSPTLQRRRQYRGLVVPVTAILIAIAFIVVPIAITRRINTPPASLIPSVIPPSARIAIKPAGTTTPLTVTADANNTTAGTYPIARYIFDFGA